MSASHAGQGSSSYQSSSSMPMTVAVTGASGFVGRHIVKALLACGHSVRAMGRDTTKLRRVLGEHRALTFVHAGTVNEATAAELLKGAHACVNTIGLLREVGGGQTFRAAHVETTRTLVNACRKEGVRRFVQISALGVGDDGVCDYQRTKYEAESILKRSDLDWTIFRPALIHGVGSGFIEMAVGWARGQASPYLFMPYFQRGSISLDTPMPPVDRITPTMQPVHVEDVAAAVASCLATPASIGEIYNLAGSEALSWPEMLYHIRDALPDADHGMHAYGVPSDVAAHAAWAAGKIGLGSLLPFDRGMALMGGQDATDSLDKARVHLGFAPRAFTSSFSGYANRV